MTDPGTEVLSHELVQQHARTLRSLTHALLADVHAAEEVVQETWIAALERPPEHPSGIGGWLRQVARRTASKHRRGDARRTLREHEASRPESLAPTDEVVAQREVLRRVMDAVLALEEPYQSVILLRFYQDLPPREIARRHGVPVVTVNSQIQRALKKLREHLDADGENERGHWACALAVATGWERGVPAGMTPAARPRIERWAMDWKLWIGASGAAAVVVVGTSAAKTWLEPGARTSGAVAEASLPDAGVTQALELTHATTLDATQSERRPAIDAAQPAGEAKSAAHAARFELSGVVVDELDRPVPGAHVLMAPSMQPLCDLGPCDDEGRFRVAWLGDTSRMRVTLAVHKRGFADMGMQELELVAGAPTVLRIATRNAMAGFEPRMLQQAGAIGDEQTKQRMESVLERVRSSERYLPRVPIVVDDAGLATFRWPAENLLIERHDENRLTRAEEERRMRQVAPGPNAAAVPSSGSFSEGVTGGKQEPRVTILDITVLDAQRQPVADVPTQALASDGQRYSAITQADGRAELEVRGDVSWLELGAGGGDFGIDSERIELVVDEEPLPRALWVAQLERGSEVRGTLAGAEGVSFDDWIVEFRGGERAALWSDTTLVDAAGFAIPNLPSASGVLLLRAGLHEVLPRMVIDAVQPGSDPTAVAFELEDPGQGSLNVTLADAQGAPIEDADVRVWQLGSGVGVRMRFDAATRQYVRDALPAGRYRVTAGSPAHAYRELGEVEVAADETASLGSAVLATGGELVLDARTEVARWQLVLRTAGVETLVAAGPGNTSFHGRLPVGEYALHCFDAQGASSLLPLAVRAGEVTTLAQ